MSNQRQDTVQELERENHLPSSPATDQPKSSTQILNLPAILWRRRWVIVLAITLSLTGSFLYLRRTTPLYRAAGRVFVGRMGEYRTVGESSDVQPLSRATNYRGTQVEILESPLVLSRVAEQPEITAMKTFAGAQDNIVAALRVGLTVKSASNDLIEISFSTRYAAEAAPIANAITNAYIAFCNEYKKTSSGEVLQVLQKEQDKLAAQLNERLDAIARFRSQNPDLVLAGTDKDSEGTAGGTSTLKRIDAFNVALAQAQIDAVSAKANLDFIRSLNADPKRIRQYLDMQRARGQAVPTDPEEVRMRSELAELYLALHDREGRFGSGHPRYQSIISRINALEADLSRYDAKVVDAQLSLAEEQLKAAEQKVQALSGYLQSNSSDSRKLNDQATQYDRMQADLKQVRDRLDVVTARIREMSLSQDLRAMNVMLVEAAGDPAKPFSPNRTLILDLGLVAGLGLGFLSALLLERFDDRMRSSEQMAAVTGLPILGILPEVPAAQGRQVARTMENAADTPLAEAIRTFRTAVLFGAPEGKCRTLLITSPIPGDGKSTVAANLAEALALSGKKTLLVDADMRKPRVDKIFDLGASVGLSSLIVGRGTLAEATRHSPIENLDLIACGPIPPNPAELLHSETFTRLLATLSQTYDHIILDAPPVLLVSDPRILAAMCDSCILVLRANQSRQRLTNHAQEALLDVGGHLLGILINGAPERSNQYGYGHGYGYGYGYGYGKDPKPHLLSFPFPLSLAGRGPGRG